MLFQVTQKHKTSLVKDNLIEPNHDLCVVPEKKDYEKDNCPDFFCNSNYLAVKHCITGGTIKI